MIAAVVLVLAFGMLGAALLLAGAVVSQTVRRGGRMLLMLGAVCVAIAAWGVAHMAQAHDGNRGLGHAESHDWCKGLEAD